MKKILSTIGLATAALAIGLFFTGCSSLVPHRVEFFQSKVKGFPEQSDTLKEDQRKAAALASIRATETYLAAVKDGAPVSVTAPAKDTIDLTHALSTSLGPPKYLYKGPTSTKNLVDSLNYDVAKFNGKIEDFKERNDKFEGKKIEGTGIFSVGYFTYVGIILLVLFLLWTALKMYGMVNPVVGTSTSLVGRVSSSVLSKGIQEVTAGGEAFKSYIAQSGIEDKIKAEVLDLFSRAHKENQSSDVQKIVQTLTV
jgi:hypothetical protein